MTETGSSPFGSLPAVGLWPVCSRAMQRPRLTLNRLVVLVMAMSMCAASLAYGAAAAGPTRGAEYFNGVSSGTGKTSVQIDVGLSGRRVTAVLTCFQRRGVQVQADVGAVSFPLHNGAFKINKTYEVDKLIPDDGETVEETGHGKVFLTARFTNGEFVGRVQIKFAGFRAALHYGKGCRASNYKAPIRVVG
jgi:hypothetical protein